MQSLKIGFVFDDSLDKTDGVQQYVLTVGEWLRAQGHDVHYLVGQTKRHDLVGVKSLSRNLHVRFNRNRMSMPLPAPRRLLKATLAAESFDVLHVQMPYSPWLAHRLIRLADPQTAVIGTFHIVAHSPLVRQATHALALWTRRSLRRFDDVVSVSPAAAAYATITYGIKTEVVPNAVDYHRFHEAQPLPDGSREQTILFLGRLVERKGCRYLLEAVRQLESGNYDLPPYRVLICGKGPLLSQLEQFVDRYDLADKVTFAGYIAEDEKPRYYASADIAVFPSTGGESFGIVLIEALASGRPVVLAGDNDGYRSVLGERSELLFDPHGTGTLADLLAAYLLSADKRQKMAAWGADYARQFGIDRVGATLLKRYRQALRKRRPA